MSYTCALETVKILFWFSAAAFLVSVICHKHTRIVLTAALAALILVAYYPVIRSYYAEQSVLKNLVLSLYATLRLFMIDGDFELVQKALAGAAELSLQSRELYEGIFLALYIAAPVATATVILSFFSGITEYLRLYVTGIFKKLYIFSELNDRSVALAKDIGEKNFLRTIVFCDVYRKNEEPNSELLEKAQKMGAICLKADVLKLKVGVFLRQTEYFLIGIDEAENLNHAIRLTERYKHRKNTTIYVWATSPESGCILDSLQLQKNDPYPSRAFTLRRINDVEAFAWSTLRKAELFKTMGPEARISILIVGMGRYGMEFLKAALWMYQMEGVRLEINVVDYGSEAQKNLWHQCRELMQMNDCSIPGEAQYSIRFLENMDIFQGEFDQLLLGEAKTEDDLPSRLQRTKAIFVALGDDDTNIRAALELRQLFDRVHYSEKLNAVTSDMARELEQAEQWIASGEEAEKKQAKDVFGNVGKALREAYETAHAPAIYAPVYDIQKSANITLAQTQKGESGCTLRCYENIPYNIHFLGSFEDQYSYEKATRTALERKAIAYHLAWSSINQERDDRCKFNQYEYYRRSSMAQAIHKEMMMEHFGLACTAENKYKDRDREKVRLQSCMCSACQRLRVGEHMRWNAYMRAEGYCGAPGDRRYKVKLPRAKMHFDLMPYEQLSQKEKAKDASFVP